MKNLQNYPDFLYQNQTNELRESSKRSSLLFKSKDKEISQWNKQVVLLLSLLFVYSSGYLKAQTVDTPYVDGHVYFRVNTQANIVLDAYNGVDTPLYLNTSKCATFPSGFQALIQAYHVLALRKAFNFRNAPLVDNIYRVIFKDSDKVNLFIADLQSLTYIDFAEKCPLYKNTCSNENITFWNDENISNWHLRMINHCNAQSLIVPGNPIRVAVVDDGFDVQHSDLQNVITLQIDVADNDASAQGPNRSYHHGTHVAGIVGAENNNGVGVASLGGNMQSNPIDLFVVKTNSDFTVPPYGILSGIIQNGYSGIDAAAQSGASVINCSWGMQTNNNTTPMSIAEQQALANTMITYPNFILVVAAGNSNTDNPSYPAAVKALLNLAPPFDDPAPLLTQAQKNRVFAVAATNLADDRSLFSNFGNWVDIAAPGSDIFSTTWGNTYQYFSGTSMAAPLVSALCGIVWHNNPTFNAIDVIQQIQNAAHLRGNYVGMGSGRIDAAMAMANMINYDINFNITNRTPCANIAQTNTPPSANSTFDIALDPFSNIPNGVVISSFFWELPGSNLTVANSTSQNLTGLRYNTPGTYPVICTMTMSDNTVQHFNATINVLGNIQATPVASSNVCLGSEQEIRLEINDGEELVSAFNINYSLNGVGNSYIVNEIYDPAVTMQFTRPKSCEYPKFDNFKVFVNQLEENVLTFGNIIYTNINGIGNDVTCPIVHNDIIYNAYCCDNNIIQNGDFAAGNTQFNISPMYIYNCAQNVGGRYCVAPTPSTFVGMYLVPNRSSNSLLINARCPSGNGPCSPFIINGVPTNNPQPNMPNTGEVLWEQQISLFNNHDYSLGLFTTQGNNRNANLPLSLRIEILDNTNNLIFQEQIDDVRHLARLINIFNSPNSRYWQQIHLDLANVISLSGIYTVRILQWENFAVGESDFAIDDIELRPIFPFTITSQQNTNCLPTNGSLTLHANPPISGVTNYQWSGPVGGIIGASNTQDISVQSPGTYTVTASNSSPYASNCTVLTATYTVLGLNVTSVKDCIGDINNPAHIVIATGSNLIPAFTVLPTIGVTISNNDIFFTIAGSYTITATDVCTTTTVITVDLCCPNVPSNAIYITSPNIIDVSTNPILASGLNSNTYVIDADLNIDVSNWTINSSLVYLTANKTITMNNGSTFNILASQLEGCTSMWNKIIADDATESVVINQSNINDALNGIEIKNDANISASNLTQFHNCGNYGIKLDNITSQTSTINIDRCSFTSTPGAMKAPMNAATDATQRGIYAFNVIRSFNIGNFAGWGNNFSTIKNGISLNNTYGAPPTDPVQNYIIGLYNNDFNAIQNYGYSGNPALYENNVAYGANIFTSYIGAGIWASHSGTSPIVKNFNLDINKNGPSNLTDDFTNCDKACVINTMGIQLQNYDINNCILGVYLNAVREKNASIFLNSFNDNFSSIYMQSYYNASINDNQITTRNSGILTPNNTLRAPIGIMTRKPQNTTANPFYIGSNTINIPAICGYGIVANSGGKNDQYFFNTVNYTTNDLNVSDRHDFEANAGFSDRWLRGYQFNNCLGTKIGENTYLGGSSIENNQNFSDPNPANWNLPGNNRLSNGYEFNRSTSCQIYCNTSGFNSFGFSTWDNCNANNPLSVKQNKFNGNFLPWLFNDINTTAASTFGDIGTLTTDNANSFIGAGNPINWMPFGIKSQRIVVGGNNQQSGDIRTSNSFLMLFESLPAPIIGYNVQNPPGQNWNNICENIQNPVFDLQTDANSYRIQRSEDVVNDNIIYNNNPTQAHWLDQRELFDMLEFNSTLRNSSSDLSNFYNQSLTTNNRYIERANYYIEQMTSSNISIADYNNYKTLALNNINLVNASLSELDANEKEMTYLWLKTIDEGFEALSTAEFEAITSLAFGCIYDKGSAVYKARALYNTAFPHQHFIDLYLCNPESTTARTTGTILNLDSLIGSNIGVPNGQLQIQNRKIEIYPNPTKEYVNIKFDAPTKEDYNFVIMDVLGKEVLKTTINKDKKFVTISLADVAAGNYIYKIVNEASKQNINFGKLTIK